MLISFFEEFPTVENLAKLKYVTWPTKLYLAATSVKEFEKIKKTIRHPQVKEIIYWPVLKKKEGYWISPFSKHKALRRLFYDLKDKNISVMIDAELPFTRHASLFISQFPFFFRNRTLIRHFIKNHPGTYVAEYFPEGFWKEKMMEFLGLHYDPCVYNCKTIKMMYHSLLPFHEKKVREKLQRGRRFYGNAYLVGYGTIAQGVLGWEPILKPQLLRKDLKIAQEEGMEEIIIFRLGGLNKKYAKVLGKVI